MNIENYFNKLILTLLMVFLSVFSWAQTASISGKVTSQGERVEFANVFLKGTHLGTTTNQLGSYLIENIPAGTYQVNVSIVGYKKLEKSISIQEGAALFLDFELIPEQSSLEEVVVSGTMKEVSKLDSPVPVEVYKAQFFKKNPSPSVFESLQNVNGVRPQVNCNVCNTGDIHINGLEGPYTMVLIDGMPIVSGLSTVYGLSGIPQSLIERVEVVKGPASTLYGSEAVGGLINIITKKPTNASVFSTDIFGTSWGEVNADIAGKINVGSRAQALVGVNYFNYQNPIDNNKDGFTDVTLQNRVSVFNKWDIDRKQNRIFSFAGRYVYEDRWGGEMNWSRLYRGGDEVYGESIYTSRWELFGVYQLPVREKLMLQFSANSHDQNSAYGDDFFIADQKIGFAQMVWDKTVSRHDLLAGLTYRYTYYDDNTPATAAANNVDVNQPSHTHLPGAFVQDEIDLSQNNKLLLGLRYDFNSLHGNILTPRINYKWNSSNKLNIIRMSIGNGYRVANVFTEDHAALTGAREVIFVSELKPEKSWNGNFNFVKKIFVGETFIDLDASVFYTYFTNKIIPDYDTHPNKIIYDNLDGFAISRGVSLNVDLELPSGLKLLAGGTLMDVYNVDDGEKEREMFAERFTGVWSVGYTFPTIGLTVDYTGNVYSPMRLPLLSELDPRSEYSPWWSIQNIQLTKTIGGSAEVYGGIKNLLNWTPNKGNPFIISRANDPFDKQVKFDENELAIVTPDNPYGLVFSPDYVFAPNQGIRAFLGFRYNFK